MRKTSTLALCVVGLLLLSSCSPRDFLTRRLAADLIASSSTFRATQQFQFTTGIISNQDYLAPQYLALQHRGWISATNAPCPPQLAPPPCWDVLLTPSGVDTVRPLVLPEERNKPAFSIPVARRELLAITGISKQGNVADVALTDNGDGKDFVAKIGRVGAALGLASLAGFVATPLWGHVADRRIGAERALAIASVAAAVASAPLAFARPAPPIASGPSLSSCAAGSPAPRHSRCLLDAREPDIADRYLVAF